MKIACLFLLFTIAYAKPQYQQFQQQQQQTGPAEPYEFHYKVENPPTNTFFGQNENGDQSGSKQGSYFVLLPDGRTLTVSYVADGQGYAPKLSYQGGSGPVAAAPVAVVGLGRFQG